IKHYVDGCAIYISKSSSSKRVWGENTGTRSQLDERNREIRKAYDGGESVSSLSERFCLCEDSIRKILRMVKE
ncbi:MAG: CD3324 family protein, partial [Eubacteriales bacterium]